MKPVQRESHIIAVSSFNGKTKLVDADEVRVCVPTKECLQFWVSVCTCAASMILGVFFMIYQGTTSVYFNIGLSLLLFAIGTLTPGPNYQAILPKKRRIPLRRTASAPSHFQRNSQHAPINTDDGRQKEILGDKQVARDLESIV